MFSKDLYYRVIKSLDFVVEAYPFPKQALVFTCLQYKSFENTVGKGEIAHNFSFSHSVFYWLGKLSGIFKKFEIVVCKLFLFGRV